MPETSAVATLDVGGNHTSTSPCIPTARGSLRRPDEEIASRVWWLMVQQVPPDLAAVLSRQSALALVERATGLALGDLNALVARDPAASSAGYVLTSYACFQAMASHRLAHELYREGADTRYGDASENLLAAARALAERAKVTTGVEIHPAATIGPRCVLDHGTGTVIGETVVIGSDCYLLQGVVLGSTGIADNPSGPRHPTLGDGVEVGAFVRVLGAVRVGDGCTLDPHTVVTTDIPAHSRVRLVTQCQVASRTDAAWIAGVRLCQGRVAVWGTGLSEVTPALLTSAGDAVDLNVQVRNAEWLIADLPPFGWDAHPDLLLVDRSPERRRAVVRLAHQWRADQRERCQSCPAKELS